MIKRTRRGKRGRLFPELPQGADLNNYYHRLSPDRVTKDVSKAIATRQAGVSSRLIVKLGDAGIMPAPQPKENTPPIR